MKTHLSLTRRDWLKTAAGASLLASCGQPESGQETTEPMPEYSGRIIDAHVHVWTPDTETYPLAPGFTKENMDPPSFTPEELFAHCRPAGVNRINLIQMSYYGPDNSYMLEAIAKYPDSFAGTALLHDVSDESAPSPDEAMVELSRKGVYAIRVRGGSYDSPANTRWLDHPNYNKMYQAGAEHNLAMSFLINPADMHEVDRMSARYPETPVIIDHLCRISADKPIDDEEIEALCRLARHKKIMVKVGAFYALGEKKPPYLDLLPMIRRVVEAYGPERCMWESDSPFQVQPPHTYEASVALIRDHADFLSPADKEQILVKTAENFFFNR